MKTFNQPANQTDLFTRFSIQANYNKLEIFQRYDVSNFGTTIFGPKKEKLSSDFLESSNYTEYTDPVSGNTFLLCKYNRIEESVLEELKKSTAWSLLIDESNTITHNKTCAIVSNQF
ncbi:30554_t:CDS:2 [Gigaspora margarita]|uniref:30554_t:CDS:1 n=1 Tax=Gigaspora margarita TaxID=4874 RepID=A0ABN7VHY7_GIGMA|nr:30554_t:CDS:2 [Gigaspora margarita]